MPLYVADLLLDNVWMLDKEASERMRMVCWMTAQVNSKKQLRPEDIIKFAWEKERERERDTTPMTKERMDALQQQAQMIRQKIMTDKQNGK